MSLRRRSKRHVPNPTCRQSDLAAGYAPVWQADLYREGASMHHCIGSYADEIRDGRRCSVYSIRRGGERLATAGLLLNNGTARLQQIRGPCNARSCRNKSARQCSVGYERKHAEGPASAQAKGPYNSLVRQQERRCLHGVFDEEVRCNIKVPPAMRRSKHR